MERINALVIAPYAEMASHVLTLQSKYPILNLQTFVGYYQNAIAYTRAFPDQHFDVVISRGALPSCSNSSLTHLSSTSMYTVLI